MSSDSSTFAYATIILIVLLLLIVWNFPVQITHLGEFNETYANENLDMNISSEEFSSMSWSENSSISENYSVYNHDNITIEEYSNIEQALEHGEELVMTDSLPNVILNEQKEIIVKHDDGDYHIYNLAQFDLIPGMILWFAIINMIFFIYTSLKNLKSDNGSKKNDTSSSESIENQGVVKNTDGDSEWKYEVIDDTEDNKEK